MARPSKQPASSDEALSDGSEEEEPQQLNEPVDEEDEEELEAVARSASSADEDDDAAPAAGAADENGEADGEEDDDEIMVEQKLASVRRPGLSEMQRLKKQKIQDIWDQQNATIDADVNNKGKGRLKYLLQQTEIFAHFAKGNQSASQKIKGRGRHESKITEEEEDEECLEEEEDGLSGTGNMRLMTQPSCIQGKMRDYQLAGLNWLIRLYENGINGILADEMGLGKTLQTISLMGYLHEFRGITGPHMVVAPKSTLGNWMNEIRCFCPVLRAVKFPGNPEERRYIHEDLLVAGKFDVCVTSFEMAIKEKSALRPI
ncbi:hypothetical protein NL676_028603 [Syzygium grande]|nr:hypothetical protein NL676_028603 [Syzygium grande]